jgi:nitronate monooxygenase
MTMEEVEDFPTTLTTSLGIRVPIIQAPIGSFSCPELAAAVSEAGGLGTLALSWDSLETCRRKIEQTQMATRAPFGINLVLEWDQMGRLDACLEAGVRVISFFWGDAGPYISRVGESNVKVLVIVGSSEEARRAVDAGANIIVCQGFEAGGHIRGLTGSIALIPAVVEAISPVPVVAAGGLADGRGLAAALALGAAGVWMGTRFSASAESRAHDNFKKKLVSAKENETDYLTLFDGNWPNAPHRVLRNSTVKAWREANCPESGARPNERQVIGRRPDGTEILRYDDTPPIAGMQGDWEACALYAGESAGLIHQIQPAAAIVHEIVRDAKQTISRLAGHVTPSKR